MTTPTSIAHVPVIDLAPFEGTDPSARARLVEQVRRAGADVGFLVVTGHGIAPDLLDRMGAVSGRSSTSPSRSRPCTGTRSGVPGTCRWPRRPWRPRSTW